MELAAKHRAADLEIRTDSELLARQLKGSYRVRAENLKPLWEQAQRAMKQFKRAHIVIIPRTLNQRADALANQALDEEVQQ
jgi:ribonuclease HI